ncbi:MAG: HupE/UreJ family protein [Pseudomonadota bacterium]
MTKPNLNSSVTLAIAGLMAAVATPVSAHHPTGGAMPTTLWHGLLSGLGHPVIGLDHLAFLIGVGLFAAIAGLGLAMPALFLVFMGAGLFVHVAGIGVPAVELMIALSVVAVGLACVLGRTGASGWVLGGLFGLAGSLHGYAFAEAIIGAEIGVISAYVAGLVIVQFAIAAAAYGLTRMVMAHDAGVSTGAASVSGFAPRLAGVAVFAAGASFVLSAMA